MRGGRRRPRTFKFYISLGKCKRAMTPHVVSRSGWSVRAIKTEGGGAGGARDLAALASMAMVNPGARAASLEAEEAWTWLTGQ